MVLGHRGYRQLLPGSVRKNLSAKDTPRLPQPHQPSLYLYRVGEDGDAGKICNMVKKKKKKKKQQTLRSKTLLLCCLKSLLSRFLQRELLCCREFKVVAGSCWLLAKSLILHKPIKVL